MLTLNVSCVGKDITMLALAFRAASSVDSSLDDLC